MTIFDNSRRYFNSSRLFAAAVALLAFTLVTVAPAFAADVPDDDDQDILVRTTLMTFNDANMSNNYTVFYARASKEWQAQTTVEKLQAAFEPMRKKELDLAELSTADYDSSEKPTFDPDGALVLAGVFKTDDLEVKYRLRYVKNDQAWKVIGVNVDATRSKK
jgi:hypothetical protein